MSSTSNANNSVRNVGSVGSITKYFSVVLLVFGVISLAINTTHGELALSWKDQSQLRAIRDESWSVNKRKQKKEPESSTPLVAGAKKERLNVSVNVESGALKLKNLPLRNKAEPAAAAAAEEEPNMKVAVESAALKVKNSLRKAEPAETTTTASHKLAGLDCNAHGGPSNDIAKEMVFWEDIPSDSHYVSPFKQPGVVKYLTFEPDGGGWNNIRMAMETVLALAVAMGRTLVLPPEQGMYLIDKGNSNKQRKSFSFAHFFHMESISNEHVGVEIITMKEFLEREALTGHMVDSKTKQVTFPPGNRTDWDGEAKGVIKTQLNGWLRSATHLTVWNPDQCMAAFPAKTGPEDIEALKQIKKDVEETEGGFKSYEAYVGKPFPVDASPKDRMKEMWAGRKDLCIYDQEMQDASVVHFPHDHNIPGARLLVHFYAFLFFEDWKQALWMKRFIRDHMRYIDEIQCAAARVVHALRERAKKRDPKGNPDGLFDAFHIRRGDFQYKVTRFDAPKIYDMSKNELTEGSTVYIATDEKNKGFFQPLADKYDVVYLDDFLGEIGELNTNYYGMLDSLIASKSRVFFGCWFSTFTGYINRIRGYRSVSEKLPGHEGGLLPTSYYYTLEDRKLHLHEYYPVKQSFYAREFPTSWMNIDQGIGELR